MLPSKLPEESDLDYAALAAYAAAGRPSVAGTALAPVALRNRWDDRLTAEAALAPVRAMHPAQRLTGSLEAVTQMIYLAAQAMLADMASRPHEANLSFRDMLAAIEVLAAQAGQLAPAASSTTAYARLTPEQRRELMALDSAKRAVLRAATIDTEGESK